MLTTCQRQPTLSTLPTLLLAAHPYPYAAVDDDADYFSPDEDQVFTSPLRLLQAIDLYMTRLQGGRGGATDPAGRSAAQLTGAGIGLTLAQMQTALRELREDVEAYWSGSDSEAC